MYLGDDFDVETTVEQNNPFFGLRVAGGIVDRMLVR